MTPQEKLTAVFNKYAGLVVDARGFEGAYENALRARLTEEELDTLRSMGTPDASETEARMNTAQQKAGDGSFGLYWGKGGLYFNICSLEVSMDARKLPAEIVDKLADALDAVFGIADDFSAQVKNGALKPLPKRGPF